MEGENNDYLKGFNHAYLLAKYKPELMKSITQIETTNNYFKGLNDGKLTFERSKVKARYLELEKLQKFKDKNRERDMER